MAQIRAKDHDSCMIYAITVGIYNEWDPLDKRTDIQTDDDLGRFDQFEHLKIATYVEASLQVTLFNAYHII